MVSLRFLTTDWTIPKWLRPFLSMGVGTEMKIISHWSKSLRVVPGGSHFWGSIS